MVGPRFTLIGSVLDKETGEPIADARLFTMLGYGRSGEDGRYKLTGVVKSAFFRYVWISKEGYEDDQHTIELGASILGGPVQNKDFKLTKVRPGTLRVTARDVSGQPLEGVVVTVTDWGSKKVNDQATTGPSGDAVLEGVPPRGRHMRATKEGYIWIFQRTHEGQEFTSLMETNYIRMEPGGEQYMEVVMAPVASVAGRVTDSAGKPLAGVDVRTGIEELNVKTDAKGKFSLRGLPREAKVNVWCSMAGFVSQSVRVTAGTGVPVEVTLLPAATIAGKVVDEDDRPIADVSVVLSWDKGSSSMDTEDDGTFLYEELAPGTYTVVARRDGFAPVSTPAMTLRESEAREDVIIRLPVGIEARVEPTLADGTPAMARVVLYGPMENPKEERISVSGTRRGNEEPVTFRLMPGLYKVILSGLGEHQSAGAVEVERNISGSGEIRIPLVGKVQRITIRPVLPARARPRGMNLKRTEPEEPPTSFWIWGDELWNEQEGLMRSPPLPDGKYKVGVYYTDEETGAWTYKELEDVEPGGDPVTLDFTK
jgi:protocatechuate 3,4-dioxygenase beta subunit